MGACLVIVEVSQKQAYIFSSNKLKDNIANSATIAYVTSSDYFKTCCPDLYQEEENEVYCGGGHSVLEFKDDETAKDFIRHITFDAKKQFPELELFATIHKCEAEPSADEISILIENLEKKKALRRASFAQGTFGVEDIDPATKDAELLSINGEKYDKYKKSKVNSDEKIDGYELALAFEDLGGSKGESNFIAVVHVDGNAMGKRVEDIREKFGEKPWKEYRAILKQFSDGIDDDFKTTFKEMCNVVAANIEDGKIGDIKLKAKDKEGKLLYFPIRRVITEGDDICFVTEGRIGIECARIFMELLSKKKNIVDEKNYAACAGVAIVHQKYPFYMAYDLAEELCSNAKKYVANSTKDIEGVDASNVCAIDWHVDFGELGDGIDDIRRKYSTDDGKRMELRPYFISGPDSFKRQESARDYQKFRKVIEAIGSEKDDYARNKIKGLRSYIREGETASWNYLKANLIDDLALNSYVDVYDDIDYSRIGTGKGQDRNIFIKTSDGVSRSILFDAIEASDTFVPLDEEGKI